MPLPPSLHTIARAAIQAVEPRAAVRRALAWDGGALALADGTRVPAAGRVWVAAAGKAAAGMAEAAVEVLGGALAGGTVAVPAGTAVRAPRLVVWEAAHPVPDAHSLAAAAEALDVARRAGPGDVLLCLLSGGASALWAAPDGVSLGELARATAALLRAGVPIGQVNAVRRRLSRIGGGGLARAAAPARVLTLAVSDVVGAPPHDIGSGPTVPDPLSWDEALAVAHGTPGMPPAVVARLQAGAAGALPAAPAGHDALFRVVADNGAALAAAAAAAEGAGYPARVAPEPLHGEARDAAARIAREVRGALGSGARALLFGGETTVAVRGDGRGGRSQELALALAVELAGVPGWQALAFGTDGVDGPTPAAGAWVDGGTAERGGAAGADARAALARNDSHGFFRAEGGAWSPGPTGTNVADVVVVLLAPAQL